MLSEKSPGSRETGASGGDHDIKKGILEYVGMDFKKIRSAIR
jgi:hypothetical protein